MNKIHIYTGHKNTISAKPDENLLSALSRHGIEIPAPCGGNGTCGKCAVHTSEGIKLACQTPATDGMEVYPPQSGDKDFVILDSYESVRPFAYDRDSGYGIAIDIGTTTLAFELISMATGRRICSHSTANSQRAIGADVVTRIKQATQGAQTQLHAYIIEDIRQGIAHILKKTNLLPSTVNFVSIAGNTTMLHLLQNMPCDTLGVFPFTPVDIGMKQCDFAEVFGSTPVMGDTDKNNSNCDCSAMHSGQIDAELLLLPGISTFVGADISAGILCCANTDDTRPNLLIDLGTNGEMALFTNDRVLVTSTAAGPAFEAGNISMGVASIPGAVAKARYCPENNVFICETINNRPPIGICGTGVVDIAAELIRNNLADETGRLEDEYFDDGVIIAEGIIFTQKDMREIQLAKSAVRSGIEILLDVAGYGYNDIGHVYLAGGFGHRINMDSAVALGLIPPHLADKIVTVGNTSLGGAAHVLLSRLAESDIKAIVNRAEEINLSTHPRFNDLFMEHMMFE